MNSLSVFNFETNTIRIIDQNGDPWFVLRDLLDGMGSSTTTTNAIDSIKQGLGEGYSNEIPLQTAGGVQQVIIVAEPAATYLVARSNTERGRKLNRFIHVEVLPSIRKTGGFQTKTMSLAELALVNAQALVALEKEQARLALEQQQLLERQEVTEQRLDQIETASDHFTIMGWWRYAQKRGSLPIAEAAKKGHKATLFCKEHAVTIGEVPDPRFGVVNTYPKWVLDELFES